MTAAITFGQSSSQGERVLDPIQPWRVRPMSCFGNRVRAGSHSFAAWTIVWSWPACGPVKFQLCQCLFLCKETDALYLTGLALVFCPELVSSSHPLEIATLFSTALIFGSSSGKSRRYFLLHREKLSQTDETVRLAAMILQSHRPSPTIEISRLYFVIKLVFLPSKLFRRR